MFFKQEEGSVFIELIIACIFILVFFFVCVETTFLIRDKLYLQRIARDGAREAVITGRYETGQKKAQERARQFFGKTEGDKCDIRYDPGSSGNFHWITFKAEYRRPMFLKTLSDNYFGQQEVTLGAKATFGWKDNEE